VVASSLAGCGLLADLSQFDGFTTEPPETAPADATTVMDAKHVEAGPDGRLEEASAEAALDVTVGDEDGGEEAASNEGGDEGGDEGGLDGSGEDADAYAGDGACVCSSYGATATTCLSPCQPTCAAYFGDCNASSMPSPDDGCETYLDSLTKCKTSCTSSATACAPAEVCNAGACSTAQGLVVLTVPFTMATQIQRYADRPSSPWSLANAQTFVRMYAPGATAGDVFVYLSDFNSNTGAQITLSLSALASGWTDVVVPAAVPAGSFDPTMVKQVTIEIQAGPTGPWESPTVVYIDSVRTTNLTLDDTFDTSIGNMVSSNLLVVAGSTLTWQDHIVASDGGSPEGGASDGGVSDGGSPDGGPADGGPSDGSHGG
jgi:hypothetical protein